MVDPQMSATDDRNQVVPAYVYRTRTDKRKVADNEIFAAINSEDTRFSIPFGLVSRQLDQSLSGEKFPFFFYIASIDEPRRDNGTLLCSACCSERGREPDEESRLW